MSSVAWRGLTPLLLALTVAVLASPPSPRAPSADAPGRRLYQQARPAVVWMHAAGQGKGSGWLLDRERRLLVTCSHVVGDNDHVEGIFAEPAGAGFVAERAYYLEHLPRLRREGRAVSGRVLRTEPDIDLALVQLDALPPGITALPLAAASASPGQRVQAIGNRYDSPVLWVCAVGTVRQRRLLRDGYANGGKTLARGARVLEASVPVNEGDSGGPLLNERGEVVGVTAAVAWEFHGAGLFVDVAEVRALLTRAGLSVPSAVPPRPMEPIEEPRPRDVYRQALRSFVLVRQQDGTRRGSGFVLDYDRRLLLVGQELVGHRKKLDLVFPAWRDGEPIVEASYYQERATTLRRDGRLVDGVVLAVDERRALALVEAASLPADVQAAALTDEAPQPGDFVQSLGNPERSESLWMYCGGWVRQRGRVRLGARSEEEEPEVLLVQAPVHEGEAGGPLLDGQGRVVGVVSGKAGPQQLMSYAVRVSEVRTFLAENRAVWKPQSVAEHCVRGHLFGVARLYERSVAEYDAALVLDPDSAVACCERGGAWHLLGRNEQAVADCTRALTLDDALAAAYVHRAAARCSLGQLREALVDADAGVRLAPKDGAARAVRARVRRTLNDLDGALVDAGEAIWLEPKAPAGYLEKGRTLLARGRADEAVAELDHALLLDPQLPDAHTARGDAHWLRADVRAALADYEQALRLDAGDMRARLGRGRARLARKEYDAGLADLDAVVQGTPRLTEVYPVRGGERLRRGDLDAALADFREGLRLRPSLAAETAATVERRSEDLVRAGRPDVGAEACRRVLELLRPRLADKPALSRAVDDALTAAARENDVTKRADLLRKTLSEVRDALAGE